MNDTINEKSAEIYAKLEDLRKSGANILLPSIKIGNLSPWHELVLEEIYLSTETKDGDIYVQQQGDKPRYAITNQGLIKLGTCAGIMWHPTESKRLDDRSDRDYVSFRAVGGVRKTDGEPYFEKAEYDLDFEVVIEEIETQYEEKAKSYIKNETKFFIRMSEDEREAYIEKCIRRDILQKRKHKAKLAETGAKNRVRRSLLGLKSTYTKAEISKPFVVPRTVLRPDYNDPEVKKLMMQASVKSITSVYGGLPDFPQIELPHEQAINDVAEPMAEGAIDITPDEGQEPFDTEDLEPDGNPPEGDPSSITKEEFFEIDELLQISILEALMEKKGFPEKDLKAPLSKFKEGHRRDFYEHLIKLPDATTDDIPF